MIENSYYYWVIQYNFNNLDLCCCNRNNAIHIRSTSIPERSTACPFNATSQKRIDCSNWGSIDCVTVVTIRLNQRCCQILEFRYCNDNNLRNIYRTDLIRRWIAVTLNAIPKQGIQRLNTAYIDSDMIGWIWLNKSCYWTINHYRCFHAFPSNQNA